MSGDGELISGGLGASSKSKGRGMPLYQPASTQCTRSSRAQMPQPATSAQITPAAPSTLGRPCPAALIRGSMPSAPTAPLKKLTCCSNCFRFLSPFPPAPFPPSTSRIQRSSRTKHRAHYRYNGNQTPLDYPHLPLFPQNQTSASLTPPSAATYMTPSYRTLPNHKSESSSTDVADNMDLFVAESSLCSGTNELRQVTIRRVLEEVPKVANLIMQFSRRYGSAFGGEAGTARLGLEDEENEEGAADLFLAAFAASQQTRLRSIIHEATNWLGLV